MKNKDRYFSLFFQKSLLDSGKEMAMFALEAKMMHGGMGKKVKYDAKKHMFNAVTKGFK